MERPQRNQSCEQLTDKLVQDLAQLRDRLTQMSLLLHDLMFELDDKKRRSVSQQAADCIARSESRQP